MKIITKKFYKCEICKAEYGTEKEALSCESQPITQDQKAKVGSIVLITGGEGEGGKAKVSSIHILDKYYGQSCWKKYWHTIALTADLMKPSYGTRFLTFDQYKIEVLVTHE